jgi:hypothetical protein
MASSSAGFFGWLRRNSEHYLLIAAHEKLARRDGTPGPRPPKGLVEIFWRRVFAPVYGVLPWPVRSRIMHARQPPQDVGTAAALPGPGRLTLDRHHH